MAGNLNPTVGSFYFSIPTVVGVVSHFVGSVLSKSNCLWTDANFSEEKISPAQEVSHGLVLDDILL